MENVFMRRVCGECAYEEGVFIDRVCGECLLGVCVCGECVYIEGVSERGE